MCVLGCVSEGMMQRMCVRVWCVVPTFDTRHQICQLCFEFLGDRRCFEEALHLVAAVSDLQFCVAVGSF